MAKATLHHHPAAIPPMPAVARILSQFDRPKLEGFISVAIGLLDVFDGDPELEDDDPAEAAGDEDDGTDAEDEQPGFASLCRAADGPGCLISDPDKGLDDGCERDLADEGEREEF